MRRLLYLEPFDAGSHAAFTQTLTQGLAGRWVVGTLPGRHWKWRMRGAAVHFARERPELWRAPVDLVFASAYLALADLVALRPALATTPRVLYFHENQLTFPVREAHHGPRDHHFGFTQLVSALAATRCVFNSRHNRDSFLEAGAALLERMPDAVDARGWIEAIAGRAQVIGVPLALPALEASRLAPTPLEARAEGPIILWSHRWEHDKRPEAFFGALRALEAAGEPFRVVVCGQRFRRAPEVFEASRGWLGARLLHMGHLPRADYEGWLGQAHLAVSTAAHEFFGVAMLEAAHFGVRPLVPDRLSYPELFPAALRYADDAALARELIALCRGWRSGALDLRQDRRALSAPHAAPLVLERFARCFDAACAAAG